MSNQNPQEDLERDVLFLKEVIKKTKNYSLLMLWVVSFIVIGYILGLLTKNSVNSWYLTLNRSPLTPPNYLFSVVWTTLYIMIAISGWVIWKTKALSLYSNKNTDNTLKKIKIFYIAQIVLNWSWTPLFFTYHFIYLSLICLIAIAILVSMIILKSYKTITVVSLLMIPYFLWLLFAGYLNLYICLYSL